MLEFGYRKLHIFGYIINKKLEVLYIDKSRIFMPKSYYTNENTISYFEENQIITDINIQL